MDFATTLRELKSRTGSRNSRMDEKPKKKNINLSFVQREASEKFIMESKNMLFDAFLIN